MKMKRFVFAFTSAVMVVSGVGATGAIAQSQPASAQKVSLCRQLGADYQDLYTFEAEHQTITICQKGQNYYYIKQPKALDLGLIYW